jgi:hypothetical protein
MRWDRSLAQHQRMDATSHPTALFVATVSVKDPKIGTQASRGIGRAHGVHLPKFDSDNGSCLEKLEISHDSNGFPLERFLPPQ